MKAQIESSGSSGFLGAVRSGKISKAKSSVSKQKKEEHAEEIKAYLNKLQEIVPVMPKDKKLSKFEVISHAIDYIAFLRETLGLPNCEEEDEEMQSAFMTEDCTVTLTLINNGNSLPANNGSLNNRQPLSVISSNPDMESFTYEVSEK